MRIYFVPTSVKATEGERIIIYACVCVWGGGVEVCVKLSPAKHEAMKSRQRRGNKTPFTLDLTLYGDEWSVSRSGRFTPRKIVPHTHWTETG